MNGEQNGQQMLMEFLGGVKDGDRMESDDPYRTTWLIQARPAIPIVEPRLPTYGENLGEYRRTDTVLDDGAVVFEWCGWVVP